MQREMIRCSTGAVPFVVCLGLKRREDFESVFAL